MSTKQDIILSYFREGKSQRQISRELDVSRKTVRKYISFYRSSQHSSGSSAIKSAELSEDIISPPRYNSVNRGNRKLTEAITRRIDEFLSSNDLKRSMGLHKQAMKKIDIHEALLSEGFQIGYTSVCLYISGKAGKRVKEAYIRQIYQPGDVCEFDWGVVKLWIKGRYRRFHAAVFTSAYTNFRYAELYERQDMASFQQAHVHFFAYAGGVYRQMVYDNMRVAVKKFVGHTEREPTEGLVQLAGYYQFGYRFCNIGRGNEKGHVERSVEYIRRKAFGSNDHFESLEQANEWLKACCIKLNASYSDKSALAKEKEFLYGLPVHPFDCCSIEQCRVDKYATVMINTNRYSMPDHLVGKMVTVKVYAHYLRCYEGGVLVAEHQRSTDKHDWVIELDHYLTTLHKKPGALHSSVALERSEECIKNIYQQHYRESPRDFIDLLSYMRQNEIKSQAVQTAINELLRMGCRQVSTDKIITLCSQNNTTSIPVPEDEIARYSKAQLSQLSAMFNQTHILAKNVS